MLANAGGVSNTHTNPFPGVHGNAGPVAREIFMSKKSAGQPAPKFPKKTFFLAGNVSDPEAATKFIKEEGGLVVAAVDAHLDYLVAGYPRGNRKTPEEKQARELNRKGAAIRVLTEQQFYILLLPIREEALMLLQGGTRGRERWRALANHWWNLPALLDLRGIDLRGRKLPHCDFGHLLLDGADLRDADLTGCALPELREVRLDGARLRSASFTQATRCRFKGTDLTDAHINPAVVASCDFAGAVLRKLRGPYSEMTDCVFRKADLREASLEESQLRRLDFRGADLSAALLSKCDFTGATFVGAKLACADLTDAVLTGADLRRADLTDALLVGADLTGAMIDGANFTGATLTGIRLGGLDPTKARGLDPAAAAVGGKVGPNLRALEDVARQSRRLQTRAVIELPGQTVTVEITSYHRSSWLTTFTQHPTMGRHSYAKTLSAGMIDLTRKFSNGKLRFDAITVKSSKCPVKPTELRSLAFRAWAEAMGVDPPSDEAVGQTVQGKKQTTGTLRDELLGLLRAGRKGVRRWNARSAEAAGVNAFRKIDLSGADLTGVVFAQLDLEGACFDGAKMPRAAFINLVGTQWGKPCNLKRASFRNADLRKADIRGTNLYAADFEGADLAGAQLRASKFGNARFHNADLSSTALHYADLRGADLTGANLAGAELERAKYDERTRFPAGFQPPADMRWKGKTPSTALQKSLAGPSGSLDFTTLLQRLQAATDGAQLSKALAMLKADRFQLFSEVGDDALTGVVKSQTDKDLVYACRLMSGGAYACCTQNLRVCGGLRGGPCKHLLVLVLGLARVGQADRTVIDSWVQSSGGRKPTFDKDLMSEVFLKYKGAEAGEVDWRPTETIPEDYYAL
jgi:uncharacterized protein YjbI with pentapeptide repeats